MYIFIVGNYIVELVLGMFLFYFLVNKNKKFNIRFMFIKPKCRLLQSPTIILIWKDAREIAQ